MVPLVGAAAPFGQATESAEPFKVGTFDIGGVPGVGLVLRDSVVIDIADATLYPGDVINNGTLGGTAAGAAATRGPEDRLLKPGDVVEAGIDGIGTLRLLAVAGEKPPGKTGARLPPVKSYC